MGVARLIAFVPILLAAAFTVRQGHVDLVNQRQQIERKFGNLVSG